MNTYLIETHTRSFIRDFKNRLEVEDFGEEVEGVRILEYPLGQYKEGKAADVEAIDSWFGWKWSDDDTV